MAFSVNKINLRNQFYKPSRVYKQRKNSCYLKNMFDLSKGMLKSPCFKPLFLNSQKTQKEISQDLRFPHFPLFCPYAYCSLPIIIQPPNSLGKITLVPETQISSFFGLLTTSHHHHSSNPLNYKQYKRLWLQFKLIVYLLWFICADSRFDHWC